MAEIAPMLVLGLEDAVSCLSPSRDDFLRHILPGKGASWHQSDD